MPHENIQDKSEEVTNQEPASQEIDNSQEVGNNPPENKMQAETKFADDTIDFIKNEQKNLKGQEQPNESNEPNKSDASDKEGNESDDNDVIPELAGTDIPDKFSEAAEATGMSPTDIIELANKHNDEELIEMIPYLKNVAEDGSKSGDEKSKQSDDDDTKQDSEETGEKYKDVDPKLIKDITQTVTKQIEEKFNTTLDEINKFKAHQEEQSQKQTLDTASKKLDDASKEFPIFGKTDELPRFTSGKMEGQVIPTSPEMKARLEVLKYADSFINSGADIDDAMDNALATYKGMHLEKELERKQVKDLKKYETKLSGSRVGKETKKKYADSRSEIIDDIRRMQRDAGID